MALFRARFFPGDRMPAFKDGLHAVFFEDFGGMDKLALAAVQ
jgi:hypothetical protein